MVSSCVRKGFMSGCVMRFIARRSTTGRPRSTAGSSGIVSRARRATKTGDAVGPLVGGERCSLPDVSEVALHV